MNLVAEDKVIVFPERMSEDEFFAFCMINPDLVLERDKEGNIQIMSPVHFNSGGLESEAIS